MKYMHRNSKELIWWIKRMNLFAIFQQKSFQKFDIHSTSHIFISINSIYIVERNYLLVLVPHHKNITL